MGDGGGGGGGGGGGSSSGERLQCAWENGRRESQEGKPKVDVLITAGVRRNPFGTKAARDMGKERFSGGSKIYGR
ncbi:hypothetical protein CORC01_02970 [Colletotrichum orchidophilum]|uniref:Uncharacterized protein n=1 Tax=Colletotrichum orchidophilum TaxID=1209926 RepID=A0A1G4BK15_9PEZI|nr:uncharacterized protein CORC01_02970 [Colletotrichum orchidophilum]OHF01779.1 hypothetical protein CORC01_02970 [Colletotrichum orchidophilum]